MHRQKTAGDWIARGFIEEKLFSSVMSALRVADFLVTGQSRGSFRGGKSTRPDIPNNLTDCNHRRASAPTVSAAAAAKKTPNSAARRSEETTTVCITDLQTTASPLTIRWSRQAPSSHGPHVPGPLTRSVDRRGPLYRLCLFPK